MNVFESIEERRSIRKYLDKPVEPEKLDKILETMRLAPSAGNRQKWLFIAVTDPAKREEIRQICNGQPAWIGEAPVILVPAGWDDDIMTCGHSVCTVDQMIAASYASLEAVELGLGTCLIASFHQEDVRKILDLPEGYVIPIILTLGYAAEAPDARPRKSAEEVEKII